jgi:hypothetical protein
MIQWEVKKRTPSLGKNYLIILCICMVWEYDWLVERFFFLFILHHNYCNLYLYKENCIFSLNKKYGISNAF